MVSLEPAELTALRRALGLQLAAAREAAGIVQQQVAHKTGYSRSSVTHAEAGRQLLSRGFWKVADELVGGGGALLAGYERVRAAKQEHECRCREAELAEAYATAQALRATTAPHPAQDADGPAVPAGQDRPANVVTAVGAALAEGLAGPLAALAFLCGTTQAAPAEWRGLLDEQLAKFLQGGTERMDRRALLRLLRWFSATVAIAPVGGLLDADEHERLVQAVVAPSRVDDQVVGHIETMLQHCKRQEDVLGPRAVLHTVLAQQQLVDSLLVDCPTGLRPRLLSVYSNMSSSVGYYFFDLDDPACAMHYGDQARIAAQEARNTELAVYALCSMSYFASCQSKAHAGIDFAAAARSLVGGTDDVLLQVCVAERAGTAYAVDGRYKECMTEFDRAHSGLVSAHEVSSTSPAYWYFEGLIVSKQSDCLLRLGRPGEAVAVGSRGLRLFDSSFVKQMAFQTLSLGTAHLQSNEVGEAARVIGDGALLAARAPSARLTKEVRTARAQMQPWQDTPAVKELDERLAGMGFGAFTHVGPTNL